jgi:hypothetical protein
VRPGCRLVAHSDASRQRSSSVAFRAKRTLIKPRWGNPPRPRQRHAAGLRPQRVRRVGVFSSPADTTDWSAPSPGAKRRGGAPRRNGNFLHTRRVQRILFLFTLSVCDASWQSDTGIDRFGHFAGLTASPQFLICPIERCARASCCAKGRGLLTEISRSTASSAVRDNIHETAPISSCALEKRARGRTPNPYRAP